MIEGLYVGCYYMRCQMLQGRARGLETLLALSGRYHRRLRGPERSRGSITYRSRKKINDNDYTVRGIEPGQPEDKNTHGYTVRKRRRGTRKLLGRAPGPSPRYIQRYINTDIEPRVHSLHTHVQRRECATRAHRATHRDWSGFTA